MIKKYIILITMIFSLSIGLFPFETLAATSRLSGPATVYSGETIQVSFYLDEENIYGISGTLSYDKNVLRIQEESLNLGDSWKMEFNNDLFLVYDDSISNPINRETKIFTISFEVNENVSKSDIEVLCDNLLASDGTKDISIDTVVYNAKIEENILIDNDMEKPIENSSNDSVSSEQKDVDDSDNADLDEELITTGKENISVKENESIDSWGIIVLGSATLLGVGILIGIAIGRICLKKK